MSPPEGLGDILFFPGRPDVRLSVRLSVTNRVRSITWKPLKLSSRNFIQISINIRRRAERKNGNSCIYIFWVISLWTLSLTKSCLHRVRSITFKPYKLASWNFIQISTSIRRRAECKNSNSCIYIFWVISLWTLSLTESCLHRVRSITFKPYKLASWNFIQISTSIRRCAECKNSNSCIYIFWVISLWTLSLTKSCLHRVRSITFKPYKLASWNFIQISTSIRGYADARTITLAFILLRVISHGTSTITNLRLNRVRSTTWKVFKLSSWIFIQISTNIRWHAEFKNCNSCINALWVIAFGTLSVTKLCLYRVSTITWKPLKLFSCNFLQISTSIRR